MDPSVPSIETMRPEDLAKYVSDEPIYVNYYPETERTGNFPLPKFRYLGWDGRSHIMPSVKRPVSFNYMKRGVYYQTVIDPVKREFIESEIRNAGQSTQYVQNSVRGPFIDVQDSDYGIFSVALYEKPRPMVVAESPEGRAGWVGNNGIGELINPWTFLVIVIMLFLVISMIGNSEELELGYRDPLARYLR